MPNSWSDILGMIADGLSSGSGNAPAQGAPPAPLPGGMPPQTPSAPGGLWNGLRGWATSPGVTGFLDQQGKNVAHAGDVITLGGTGLEVAGTVTGQPEIILPGLLGEGLGGLMNFGGNGMSVLSQILAGHRNAAVNAAISAGLQQALPPTVNPQPAPDGKYFGS